MMYLVVLMLVLIGVVMVVVMVVVMMMLGTTPNIIITTTIQFEINCKTFNILALWMKFKLLILVKQFANVYIEKAVLWLQKGFDFYSKKPLLTNR